MKINKKIMAALLALGIISSASADPIVYLTGSTAFRSTTYAALANNTGTNNGGVFDAGTVTGETFGTTTNSQAAASGADFMVFHGNINGSPVYITCAWSGSEAGFASSCNVSLANVDRNGNSIALKGSPEKWVNPTNASVSLTQPINVITNSQTAYLEPSSHGADLNLSDTSQAISWNPKVTGTSSDLKPYGQLGVVTFCITKNNQTGNSGTGTPTGASNEWIHCSNVSLAQLNALFSAGVVQADFLTGNPADTNAAVYLVGRNLGSGTRMNMLADSTYGGHRSVNQYSVGYGIEETPQVNSLILTNEGNGGYESGGGVASALGILGSCQQADPINGYPYWFALGYLGPSDALKTSNFGGEPTNCWVTVDGYPSNNGTIESGQWWYWGYEYLYGKHNNSGTADTVGNVLATSITKTLQVQALGSVAANHDSAIYIPYMQVSKQSDVDFPSR